MIASGIRDAIVNVASEAGRKGHMQSLAYSASTAALISLTRVLSAALAPRDINVNCVFPGQRRNGYAAGGGGRLWQTGRRPPDQVFPQLVSA